jgi:hypothetical protein
VVRNSPASSGVPATPDPDEDSSVTGGKGRPTPTRREKEAARKRPLVANDRAERRRQERAAAAVQREKQRVGMARGDEKFLPMRDRGPQRRYIRDYVDARWSIGELLLPMIAVFFITSFFPADTLVVLLGFGLMWFVLIAAVIDAVILGFILRKKLAAKFGEDKVERGIRLYAAMRAVYLRAMRLPKPQVKRGDFPE